VAEIVLLLLAVAVGAAIFSPGIDAVRRLAPPPRPQVDASCVASSSSDALILKVTNIGRADITVTSIQVDTDTGTAQSLPTWPSLPLTVPAGSTIVIVVGGGGFHWTYGKSYLVTINYVTGSSAQVATVSFTRL